MNRKGRPRIYEGPRTYKKSGRKRKREGRPIQLRKYYAYHEYFDKEFKNFKGVKRPETIF